MEAQDSGLCAQTTRRSFLAASAGSIWGLTVAATGGKLQASSAPAVSKRTRRVGAAGVCFRYTGRTWKTDPGMKFLETSQRAGAEVAMLHAHMIDRLDADGLKQLRARAEQLDVMLEVHAGDGFRDTYEHTLRQAAALAVKAVGCMFAPL